MSNFIKSHKWVIIATLIILLQTGASIAAIIEVYILNMLPGKYFAMLIAAFIVLLGITVGIIIPKGKNKGFRYFRRSFGTVMSLVVATVGIVASVYIGHLNNTVSKVSTDANSSNKIGVYVLKDNKADGIDKITDKSFAVTSTYDYENTVVALENIKEETGKDILTTKYETVTDMVDALFRQDVEVVVLNEAYVSILEDLKQYKSFGKKTKIVYEYEVAEEVADVRQPVTNDGDISDDSMAKKPFILYISGSDTRESTLATSRSDVNILAVVNPVSKMVLLINTPRDYYVLTSKAAFWQYDKLTHCGAYGIDCSMDTLGKLYEEEVDYYAQINFDGFSAVIDALGGVTVENDISFTSDDDYFYPKGVVTMDGAHALSFVRERHSFADGDNQRGKNQMKVIKALIAKAKDSTTLLTNYTDILASIEGMFLTNVSTQDMADLVRMQLNDMPDWNVISYSVSGTGASKETFTLPNKKTYVTVPDQASVDKAEELIDRVYAGEILTEEDTIIEDSTTSQGTASQSVTGD